MIVELGHLALILAFCASMFQLVVPTIGLRYRWFNVASLASPLITIQFLLTLLSFIILVLAFVRSDFSVKLVAKNSHTLKPLIYKISGTWGNHEGSMLLWVLILTFFGFLVAFFGNNLRNSFKIKVLIIQSAIACFFFAFILFTSNPFERYDIPPFNGLGLNPLLQDPGLAFHPPFLYLGYVGLSMSFSFAVAALIEGKVDSVWARWVRPWTLLAWIFLTIGIALGSWWAYYELGWGGWWFWDPVENASFMPWLISAALVHSAIVLEKREILKSWTILLAILAFSFSLLGTFIVRSGIITSVHAFATDPTRGIFILLILVVATGGGLALFAVRYRHLNSTRSFSVISRESALVVNNLLLVVSSFVVLIGTLWPLFSDLVFEKRVSVGPPYFDIAFTPFFVAIAMVLPVGAMLTWKRSNLSYAIFSLWPALLLGISLGALVWSFQTGGRMLGPVGVSLATWLICGALADLWSRARGKTMVNRFFRLLRTHRSDFGKCVAHCGLGIIIFGISAITAWESEDIRVLSPGETYTMGQYELKFLEVNKFQNQNYIATQGEFRVYKDEDYLFSLFPEKRFYPIARVGTTEAAIDQNLLRDLYLVLGEEQESGMWSIRTYLKPFAIWIWIGAFSMAFGGALSISDRRFRFSSGAKKFSKAML